MNPDRMKWSSALYRPGSAILTLSPEAVDLLRPLGVCGMVGQVRPGEEVSLDPNTILLGRTLRGIVQGGAIPQILIPQIIELYLQGRFPTERLIKYYGLEDINKAATD